MAVLKRGAACFCVAVWLASGSDCESAARTAALRSPQDDALDDSADVLPLIRSRLAGVEDPSPGMSPQDVAGRYSTESDELAKLIGGGFLGGSDLFLFADGRYLYTEWADVEPQAVYGWGTWILRGHLVHLSPSDTAEAGRGPRDRSWRLFRIVGSADAAIGLRMMGTVSQFGKYRESDNDDPWLTLLIQSVEQIETFDTAQRSEAAVRSLCEQLQCHRLKGFGSGSDSR